MERECTFSLTASGGAALKPAQQALNLDDMRLRRYPCAVMMGKSAVVLDMHGKSPGIVSVIDGNRDILIAEASPTEAYRYQAWRALWEDCTVLGMGYRAYHSHMMDTLVLAEKRGVKLKNPKGENLQISALTRDDLKGFLGRKNLLATGPGLRLTPQKFWVVNVFAKLRHPECVSYLDQERLFSSLLASARTYFLKPGNVARSVNPILRWSAGAYVPTMKKEMLPSLLADENFHVGMLTLPAYIIYFDARSLIFKSDIEYCLFKKFEFPITRDKLKNGDGTWYDLADYDRLQKKYGFGEDRPSSYYEGFGIFSPHSGIHDVSINLFGRHGTRYTPFFSRLTLRAILAKTFEELEEAAPSAPEWLPVATRASGVSSTKYYRLNRDGQVSSIYSDLFESCIRDMYNNLSEGRP